MGKTAYEEAVFKENEWNKLWMKERVALKKAGKVKEPSRWILGEWGRPHLMPPKPEAIKTDVQQAAQAEEQKYIQDLNEHANKELKNPSKWMLGDWRRPALNPDYPSAGASRPHSGTPSRASGSVKSSKSLPSLAHAKTKSSTSIDTMVTSHVCTEMKRNFQLNTSVLGKKYTPAYRIPRNLY